MSKKNLDAFANIQNVLDRHTDIELAYVFGSIARGTATPASDLDIAIQTVTQLNAQAKILFVEEFAAATGRAIDLIDLRNAGETITRRNLARWYSPKRQQQRARTNS